jgi:L-aminopeptidase/D-esterase-like protein
MKNNTLTALEGVKVGHATHTDQLTGCTVIAFDKDYPVAYQSNGGAPGTFNTDDLRDGMSFSRKHALFIAGGSYTGLTTASSLIQSLIERGIGYRDARIINPSISGAIVSDLGLNIAPYDGNYGREAFENATTQPVQNGNVGAGTGTTVGKFSYTDSGRTLEMKAGVGSARVDLGNNVSVCALSVVNALGNIILPNGSILAGNRDDDNSGRFRSFKETSLKSTRKSNTTISIVGINADLERHENYRRVAQIASHGQIRAINPVHTSLDGDTVFVFSTERIPNFLSAFGTEISQGEWYQLKVDIIAQAAAKAVQESIYNACHEAVSINFASAFNGIIPAAKKDE